MNYARISLVPRRYLSSVPLQLAPNTQKLYDKLIQGEIYIFRHFRLISYGLMVHVRVKSEKYQIYFDILPIFSKKFY